jgi:hypothetical protein
MWHVWQRGEVHTGFWWRDMKEGDNLEDLGIRWEHNIKIDLQEWGWGGTDWTDLAQHL